MAAWADQTPKIGIHEASEIEELSKARQGRFIYIAHFMYKTIQGALHKILEALKKHWSTLKAQKNKLNKIKSNQIKLN